MARASQEIVDKQIAGIDADTAHNKWRNGRPTSVEKTDVVIELGTQAPRASVAPTVSHADSNLVEQIANPARSIDDLLCREELAAKLGCSVSQVENLKDSGEIPYLKIRGMVRYHWPSVLHVLMRDCHRGAATSTLRQIHEHPDSRAHLQQQSAIMQRVEKLLRMLEIALEQTRL
jgi:hypothetical protein